MAAANAKLRNFLDKGLDLPEDDAEEGVPEEKIDLSAFGRAPNPRAKEHIPADWLTFERILDATYNTSKASDVAAEFMTNLKEDAASSLPKLSWVLVKWQSLPYGTCTWEKPPQAGEDGFSSFLMAYQQFLLGRKVFIPKLKDSELAFLDKPRPAKSFVPLEQQPDFIDGEKKLMDFQLEGLNWLRFKHWTKKNGVLSDEMGLGKTVQIITFISYLFRLEKAMVSNA